MTHSRTKTGGAAVLIRVRAARQTGAALGESAWSPPVDVYEAEGHYVLNAEVPGVDARDVHIEVSGCDVAIRGDRRYDTVCSEESYYRLEAIRGRFHRSFSLPEPLDPNTIRAELLDGVLRVVIPKRERTRR